MSGLLVDWLTDAGGWTVVYGLEQQDMVPFMSGLLVDWLADAVGCTNDYQESEACLLGQ